MFFLLSLTIVFGLFLHADKSSLSELQQMAIAHKHALPSVHRLPAVKHNPRSIHQLRIHRYIEFLAKAATETGVILNDIRMTSDRIQVQGCDSSVSPINNFNRKLITFFLERQAEVHAPVTTRDINDQFSFQLEIVWKNEQ
ncbi:hypothetical protein K8T06_03105 [bacterium]|nr:hypothetical protein [bacterium]